MVVSLPVSYHPRHAFQKTQTHPSPRTAPGRPAPCPCPQHYPPPPTPPARPWRCSGSGPVNGNVGIVESRQPPTEARTHPRTHPPCTGPAPIRKGAWMAPGSAPAGRGEAGFETAAWSPASPRDYTTQADQTGAFVVWSVSGERDRQTGTLDWEEGGKKAAPLSQHAHAHLSAPATATRLPGPRMNGSSPANAVPVTSVSSVVVGVEGRSRRS